MTFHSDTPPPVQTISPWAWLRVIWRGGLLVLLLTTGLVLKLVLRLPERLLFGLRRPLSPYVTQAVCRMALIVLRLPLRIAGQPMRPRGAMVANHASWLDIFALNAASRVYFVSKAEVASWPLIGWLARATGTVFIRRDRREAGAQKLLFEARLRAGHRLLFFPEGTSSDSLQVLPFKSTLFEAFFAPELRDFLHIQPVTVAYTAPKTQDPRFYGWWGDMDFARHLIAVLAEPRQGSVDITFHPAVKVADFANRKALTQTCEATIRQGFEATRPHSAETARGRVGGA